jgi:protein-S-isoprenylcysteine O-methyltransferase Ste14
MKKIQLSSASGIIYMLIIFEILFMISPLALYYYSAYGPLLNTLHSIPGISWLSGFFMPHFSESEVLLFNHLFPVGAGIFLSGLMVFIISAGQIYYAKFSKRGAVAGGLYRYIRHPQYSAFFIMGLGTLFIWPRLLILFTYVTMVFLYYGLARKEERDCQEKFGKGYSEYLQNTAMFFPGDSFFSNKVNSIGLPIAGKRILGLSVYVLTVVSFLYLAFAVRNYAISSISTVVDEKSATISTVKMKDTLMKDLLNLAFSDSRVDSLLQKANRDKKMKMLNYIVPAEWILPDLPLDDDMTSRQGHQQPKDYDRDLYKILLTRSIRGNDSGGGGYNIIRKTIKREPLMVIYVNRKLRSVTKVIHAPETVLWGDIPTPLF